MSDLNLALAANGEFGTHISGRSRNKTVAAAYYNLTAHNRLETSEALADSIREWEASDRAFVPRLGLGSGQLMEYDYEDLLLPGRVAHLATVFQFILGANSTALPVGMALKAFNASATQDDNGAANPAEVTLHPPTCSSRVTDWPRLRSMIKDTYTLRACDRLEAAFASPYEITFA